MKKHITGKIRAKERQLSIPERNQLKVARQSMKYHCAGCLIMGGPNHFEAARIIHELTGAFVNIDSDCTCS